MTNERLRNILGRIPLHVLVISLVAIWLLPALGVFVTSFRSREAVRVSGWWTALTTPPTPGQQEYQSACAPCHGTDGKGVEGVDHTSPDQVGDFTKTNRLLAWLREEVDGQPHVQDPEWQSLIEDKSRTREALDKLSPISQLLGVLSGAGPAVEYGLTTSNWIDAMVGYKGTTSYQQDCATGVSEGGKYKCAASDLLNPEGMARAFLNSFLVTVPATILPILFAAFAAYAFAWLDFKAVSYTHLTLPTILLV